MGDEVKERPEAVASKREAHRPSRRNEVIDAAVEVFSEQGPGESIAAVAKRAGMSQASIYYHFPSKDELLAAAVREISHRVGAAVSPPSDGRPLGIREAASSVWDWHKAHAAETRLLYAWAATGPPAVAAVRHEFVDRQVAIIRRRMRRPEKPSRLDDAVERLSAETYASMAMEVAYRWATGRPFAGVRSKERISDSLASVGARMTASPIDDHAAAETAGAPDA